MVLKSTIFVLQRGQHVKLNTTCDSAQTKWEIFWKLAQGKIWLQSIQTARTNWLSTQRVQFIKKISLGWKGKPFVMSLPARNYKKKGARDVVFDHIRDFPEMNLMYVWSGYIYITCNSYKKYIYITISELVNIANRLSK